MADRDSRGVLMAALAIFALALLLRLGYVETAEQPYPIRADAARYTTIVYNLIHHGTYSHRGDARTDAFISPGYPAFLLLFGSALSDPPDLSRFFGGVVFAQAILSAITALMVAVIGFRTIGRVGGALAGLLAALSPHLVVGAGYVLTETLFIAVMVAGLAVWLLADLDKGWLRPVVLFAALGAAAALIRPAYALFPVCAVGMTLWGAGQRRTALKAAGVALLVTVLVWSPWLLYKSDKPSEVSALAASFALGHYPDLIHESPRLKGYPYREDPQADAMNRDIGTALGVAWQRASREPGRYLAWYLFGKPAMFLSWDILVGRGGPFIYPVEESLFSPDRHGHALLDLFSSLHPLLVLSSFILVGMLVVRRRRMVGAEGWQRTALVSGLLFLYFLGVHTVLAPLPRYSVPLHPLLYLNFALLVHILAGAVRKRIRRGGHGAPERVGRAT